MKYKLTSFTSWSIGLIFVFGLAYVYTPSYTRQIAKLLFPKQFGKTHFIVGYPHCQITRSGSKIPDTSTRSSVLFAPNQEILTRLLDLIKHEQSSISIATFLFTDKLIAQGIIDAKERGVAINIIVDPACLQDRFHKLSLLHTHKIPLYVYYENNKKKFFTGRMHNKFIIFEKNHGDKSYIWTGSCNLTRSSYTRNQENVIILEDSDVVEAFKQAFQNILKNSVPIEQYQRTVNTL